MSRGKGQEDEEEEECDDEWRNKWMEKVPPRPARAASAGSAASVSTCCFGSQIVVQGTDARQKIIASQSSLIPFRHRVNVRLASVCRSNRYSAKRNDVNLIVIKRQSRPSRLLVTSL